MKMSDSKSESVPPRSPPIPTYHEVTSSQAPASARLGPEETSDDAERQGLLRNRQNGDTITSIASGSRGYRPPTVESQRSSTDIDLLSSDGGGSDDEDEGAERDMERLEILDFEDASTAGEQSNVRQALSKHISNISNTISSMNLAYPRFSLNFISSRLPRIPEQYRPKASIVARLVALLVIGVLVYAFFTIEFFPSQHRTRIYSEESIRSWLQATVDEQKIRENLKHITSFDHMAGSEGDLYLARWVEDYFRSSGIDAVQTYQ